MAKISHESRSQGALSFHPEDTLTYKPSLLFNIVSGVVVSPFLV